MQDFRLVKKETIDTEGAIFWNRMHPDGVECDRCYSCIAFKCLNKLKLVSNHIELIKVRRGKWLSDSPDSHCLLSHVLNRRSLQIEKRSLKRISNLSEKL